MIWVTSDLHFCHDKDFIYVPRGFSSVRDMNLAILHNWTQRVNWDDDVYVLGDIMLKDNESGMVLLKTLPGHIHIVLGNHDTDAREELYRNCYNVVEVERAIPFKYKGQPFYMTHYPTLCANGDSDKPLNKRVINLCGHSHIDDPFADWDKGLIYHCELEAHGCAPISLDSILEECAKKYKECR